LAAYSGLVPMSAVDDAQGEERERGGRTAGRRVVRAGGIRQREGGGVHASNANEAHGAGAARRGI
jgi:hypothetical protein